MSVILFACIIVSSYFLNGMVCLACTMLYALHLVVRRGRCALRFTIPAAFISVLAVSRMLLLCTPSFALAEGDVEAVCAVVVQDSTVSRWNRRAVISLSECFAAGGVSASARGVVSAGYPEGVVLLAGDTVLLVGGMDEYGFDADECIVLERGVASRSRNRLMERGRSLIAGDGGLEGELSMMLLLGCTDMPDFPLTDLARSSGTSHVLSLSGMHLSLFATLLRLVLVPLVGRRRGRALALAMVFFYVFTIGPKPSVVRAFLLSLVFLTGTFRRSDDALYMTFMLQTVLFPRTVSSLAGALSYLSLLGIMALAKPVARMIDEIVLLPSPLVSSASASMAALVTTCPLSYVVFGSYQLSAIVTSAPVSLLIYLYMIASLLPVPDIVMQVLYVAIVKTMEAGSLVPLARSLMPYFAFLASLLLLCALSCILTTYRRTRACGRSTMTVRRRFRTFFLRLLLR